MRISFFEEFPTKENLDKLRLFTPNRVFLAASSVAEFKRVAAQIPVACVYWPVLKKSEGYWISPFAKRVAVQRVFAECKNMPIMIDAELPLVYGRRLLLTEAVRFFRNRRVIREFIREHSEVYVAENFLPKLTWLFSFLGVEFDPRAYGCVPIKMVYHSMVSPRKNERRILRACKEEYGRLVLGFGTIAPGVLGNEPVLTVRQLQEDMEMAVAIGVEEVVVFRLGGLTKEIAKMLKQYQ